jgi:PAS domain S-box-containing protein
MRNLRPGRNSIVHKFTRDYLLTSTIPALLVLVLTIYWLISFTSYSQNLIHDAIQDLNEKAELELRQLGEKVIRDKARDIAKQVEIFLQDRPDITMINLQDNEYFRNIALQDVGKTGYTCLYEAGTAIMRVHPNQDLIDRDMCFLSEELPSWWTIFEPSLKGKEISGYYDWYEADGSVRGKYMTMTPVGGKFHGITLMIAATTYIDEFSQPLADMKEQAQRINIQYQNYIRRLRSIISGVIISILILTIVAVSFMAQRAAFHYIRPIKNLSEDVMKLGDGKWLVPNHIKQMDRNDEIGVLAKAFTTMSAQLHTYFENLEEKVKTLQDMQQELIHKEKRYRSLFDGIPVGLYRTTPSGELLDANLAMVEMFGFPDRESMLSENVINLYSSPECRTRWQDCMEKEDIVSRYEVEMKKHDGTVFLVQNDARTIRDRDGRVQYYEGSLKDVTESKRAEKELRESEEKFRALAENSLDVIMRFDSSFRHLYVNPSVEKLTGLSAREFIGKTHSELGFPEDLVKVWEEAIRKVFDTGNKNHIEFKLPSDIWIDWLLIPEFSQKGEVKAVITSARDISELKMAEKEKEKIQEQLMQSQKLEAVGNLTGGIAHDFNNLLTAILGSADIAILKTGEHVPVEIELGQIRHAAIRAADLTRQLLLFSRKQPINLVILDLNSIVRNMLKMLDRLIGEDIKIDIDLDPKPWAITADEGNIEQILLNLAVNARDAMEEGGALYIKTRNLSLDEEDCKGILQSQPGDYLSLIMVDTGHGIAKDVVPHIFEPFFSTKDRAKGTGLGLAVVYGIVSEHNGWINVYSEPGHGAQFKIYFPAVKSVVKEMCEDRKIETISIEEMQGNNEHILLVEDQENVREFAVTALRENGYIVFEASTANEAIDLFEKEGGIFALVFSDVILPDETGLQLIDKLSRINPDLPILFTSGYTDQKSQWSKIVEKGYRFLQKPYSLYQLLISFREILSEKD